MDRINNILVGVDFSPCAAAALTQAVRIARWNRATVRALHVVSLPIALAPDGSFTPIDPPPVDLLLQAGREGLAAWEPAREFQQEVEFEVTLGVPRLEFIERARSGHVDLLVLGAHAERDRKRGVGSVASACVQRAPTKVLIVREDQTQPFRSVAACVDFSETSRSALEQAIRVAAQDGALLHVLHVYTDPWRGLSHRAGSEVDLSELELRTGQAMERRLRAFCEPLAHETGALKAAFHVLESAKHGKGIVEFVTRERCDLVILGTRAHWNFRDFLWGSTAERVVREAPCSALAIKPAMAAGAV